MQLGSEKKTGDGFTPEDEKPPPANAGDKETKPEPCCAANIGTGNDSGCPMALVMFELRVCKGTADGGGNTCALECILLTGNETDGILLTGNETDGTEKLAMAKGLHCQIEA